MDARAVLRPVGPERPAVYWRRRAVVLVVLLLLVLLVARACGGNGDQKVGTTTPSATASPRPTVTRPATPKPTVTASATVARAAACAPGAIQVTAVTDATSYPAGVLPRLTMQVTNTTAAACTVVLGEGARHFTVFSGADRVWSTDDCPHSGALVWTTLRPSGSIAYARTWDRRRSSQGCASPGPAAQPGTYRFVAGLGDAQSTETVFHLTG